MTNENKAIVPVRNGREEINLPTSSRNVIILGLVFVALFFGGLGGWVATAKLQGAVIARGEIIVETYRKQVQHLNGGIIDQILVREGDLVEKGQVLIRLDGERVLATRDLYRGQMDALQARQARLRAEKKSQESISWPESLLERVHKPEVRENMQSEQEIFQSRLAAKNSQISLHRAQIRQLKSQIEGQERQLVSIDNTIASLKDEISVKTPLLEGRFLDRSHIMELERALHTNHARKDQLETEITLAGERIDELELKIKDLEIRYAEEAASRVGEVRRNILELREQLRPAEDASRRLEITAPESGVVVNLRVRTEGGVIQTGEPLMEIVPQDSALIVSAKVPPDKIDDVVLGQKASISLSAFPTRYTPKVDGTVTYVSADRIEPGRHDVPPHYLVYLKLDPDSLSEAIQDLTRLTPGMPAEVYIQTEAKTVLTYLLTPITESLNRAFRE